MRAASWLEHYDEGMPATLGRLAPYKVPAQVEFWDALPMTLAGKVLRRALTAGDQPAPAP